MREYVQQQTAKLLRRLAQEVDRAAKDADEEAIHDLRVAIRRLKRCLQVFSQFYPKRERKDVRRSLTELMDAAGEVRDRDIAAQLLQKTGVKSGSPVLQRLAEERTQAWEKLSAKLQDWKTPQIELKA
jgi:CHAD domain-containing protein